MNSKAHKRIYRKAKEKGVSFSHVCEVGVYLPETSNVLDFIKSGIKTTLVEADPDTVGKIQEYFKGYPVKIYPVAIWDKNGTLQLSRASASTFATELNQSPAVVNDKYLKTKENTFEVPCMVFSDIDDGTIDLLSIDIEGGEWYVLKHMTSRPMVISIETHGKYYTNPFIHEIMYWTKREGYVTWYKDASDTVFIKQELFSPTMTDRMETRVAELRISWKKFKKIFKHQNVSK